MAGPKRPTKANKGRTQVVPIRVVKPSIARPPATAATMMPQQVERKRGKVRQQRLPKSESDRRMLMWGGVILIAVVIFVAWIGFIQSDLSRRSGSDTLLSKIRSEFTDFLNRVHLLRTNANTNATDPELEDLRKRVFPEVKDQEFSTGANENVNAASLNTNN